MNLPKGPSRQELAENCHFPFKFCNFSFSKICPLGFDFLHFGLLVFHFLSFWPFGPSFRFILAFWAFISFHFGLVGFHFLSFWFCWAFISIHFGFFGLRFLSFSSVNPHFLSFWAFWTFISFHVGLLDLHFLSFWPFGLHFLSFWLFEPSFPCILAFLGLHFLSFWPCGPSFPFILVLLGLHFHSFWPFWPSFPFIFVFWAFISFHFGPFGLSFPFILIFWAFISFHVGLVGFQVFSNPKRSFLGGHLRVYVGGQRLEDGGARCRQNLESLNVNRQPKTKSLAEGSCRRRQSPKRPELRERLKNAHVKAQVKLGRCRHAFVDATSRHRIACQR